MNSTSSSPAVRVGLVGYGWWGKTIADQIANSQDIELIAVSEIDISKHHQMSKDKSLRGIKLFSNYVDMLGHPDLEAVILCSPHQAHAQQIMQASKLGLHVFCEKPLCLTLDDAQKAVNQCSAKGLILGIGHERRFEPEIIKLRSLINAGTLGEVLHIEANFSQDKFLALPKDNWRLSNKYAPVGPLTATGIHLVDLSVAILGPVQSVWARLATLGSEFENGDTLSIMMAFPNGANATITAILATPFEGRIAVYGSKGWIEIRDRTHPENPTGWDITTVLRGESKQTRFAAPYPTVLANLEAFGKAIRGDQAYPVSAQEMLANVAALEAIMRSVQDKTMINVTQSK